MLVLWFHSSAATALLDEVLPTSMPNSFQAKFPSALANVALNASVFVETVPAPETSWNQRFAEPAAADRSVSAAAAVPTPLPAPMRVWVASIDCVAPWLVSRLLVRVQPAVVTRFPTTSDV